MAWPVLGQIHRPALGRVDLSIRLVSRQRTSSSPTASNTGTVISENWSRRSCNDGRKAWQRAIVFEMPSAECCRRRTTKSRQLFWSLYLSWMRAGPRAIHSDIETIPCSIKIRARSDVSLNQVAVGGMRAGPYACRDYRAGFLGIPQPKLQSGIPAHAQAD